MAITLQGGSSTAGRANVTSTFDLQVRTPTDPDSAGFALLSCQADDGTALGSPTTIAPEASEDYRLRCGVDQTMFNMSFEGTVIATDRIQQSTSTIVVAQANGFLTLNSTGLFGSGNHGNWRTYRTFPVFGSYPLYGEMWVRETGPTVNVAVSEWGFGYAATTATPTDGAFFRRVAGGQLQGVTNFAGAEMASNITVTNVPSRDGAGNYDPTETNRYLIEVGADLVKFWINDTLVLTTLCPSNQGSPTRSSSQPMFARVYYPSAGAAARTVEIGFLNISLGDMNASKPWSHIMAGAGGGSYQIQPGTAAGPTVTRGAGTTGWPTSGTARSAGTWTATSAPAINSLGGFWTTPAISSLSSDADYPVYAYQNPTGTNALPGKTLYITGLRVGDAYVATAASTNAICLSYLAAAGSTAAATSTADAAATIAPRGVTLGAHGFLSTEIVGNTKPGFEVRFHSPLVVPPACYFHFIVRPFGTVTSNTLVVTSSLAVNGYFE
jgi:hypothetical protein